MKNKTTIISFILGLVFTYTAMVKLMHPKDFALALTTMKIPDTLLTIAVWWVPLIEISTVALLMVPSWRKAGLVNVSIILGMFTAYACYARFFGPIQCGCFGGTGETNIYLLVLRNVIMIFAAVFAIKKFENDNIEKVGL